jgi:TonB-dependent siderophore receptor
MIAPNSRTATFLFSLGGSMAHRYSNRGLGLSAPNHAQLRDSVSRVAASSLLVIGMGVAASTHAAEAQQEKTQLPTVKVEDTAVPYKAETLSSPKYTEPLRDTPQNITVITNDLIQAQGVQSLRDILSNVPGITFGGAEGGNGYGDNIILRGYDISNNSSDITVDGVRDTGRFTRSDSFNLEAVEVVKGANSVYSGAGSVSGTVNMVTKSPKNEDTSTVTAGVGTDNYQRATLDTNKVIDEGVAFRLNLMTHANEVAGRDYVEYERWGIAPSIAFGLDTDTKIVLSAHFQDDKGWNDYGVPIRLGREVPGVDRSNYYGWHNLDGENTDARSFSATVEHHFSDKLSLRNLSRWSQVDGRFINTALQGRVCIEEGQLPLGAASGGVCTASGVYEHSQGPRAVGRDSVNTVALNQFDLTWDYSIGDTENTLVFGNQISSESGERQNFSYIPTATVVVDLYDPDSYWAGPVNKTLAGKSNSELDVVAFYASNTFKFSPQWQANIGLRYDHYTFSQETFTVANGQITSPPAPEPGTRPIPPAFKFDDELVSGRVGLVYKPKENGSIYASYGTSANPATPSANTTCTFNSNCFIDPEEAINYELGTKWDLYEGKLGLTAALFRNEKKNARVSSGDPEIPQQVLEGRSRVDGLELGISGQIQENWSIFAGYVFLDSEMLQSVSDLAASTNGDPQKGHALANTPKNSGTVWTTYTFDFGLDLSYGLRFASGAYIGNGPTTVGDLTIDPKVPSHVVHNAAASYVIGQMTLQLNINNLTNEEYFTTITTNPNRWALPAPERSAIFSASYTF